MPELNIVATSAADPTGAKGQVIQPFYTTTVGGYNYEGVNNPTGDGFLEFGTGTPGSLPFKVDQAGNVTGASFTGITIDGGLDWFNVVTQYGADPTGTNDNTTAFQDALNAIATSSTGGVMYIPAGTYLLDNALTYSSSNALTIRGDGMSASSVILNSSATSITYLSITGGGINDQDAKFDFQDFSLLNNNAPTYANTNVAFSVAACQLVTIRNVAIERNGIATPASAFPNTAILLNGCNNITIDHAYLAGSVNALDCVNASGVTVTGGTTFFTTAATGVTGAAAIVCSGTTGTLRLFGAATIGGDYGLIWRAGSDNAHPAFLDIFDFEINNPAVGGIALTTGAEVWMEQLWCSDAGSNGSNPTGAVRHGLVTDANFQGTLYLNNCTFQDWSGHGIWLQEGTGYKIEGCTFGGIGQYQANTYDDIHIAAAVSNVTLLGNHHEVDAYYTPGSTKPRSAVYVESGATAVNIDACQFASAANWGTAPVVDLTNAVLASNNVGWKNVGNPSMASADFTTYTITGASYAQASKAWSIPAYDAQVGTIYRVTIYGTGTEGTTSDGLNARALAFGTSAAPRGFAASVVALSTAFAFKSVMEVQITAIGSAGTAIVTNTITMSTGTTGTGITVTNSASAVAVDTTSMSSINTQSAATMEAELEWAATTGSPTITIYSSTFERIGQ